MKKNCLLSTLLYKKFSSCDNRGQKITQVRREVIPYIDTKKINYENFTINTQLSPKQKKIVANYVSSNFNFILTFNSKDFKIKTFEEKFNFLFFLLIFIYVLIVSLCAQISISSLLCTVCPF